MVCVWKLNGVRDAPAGGGGPIFPSEVRVGVGNPEEEMGEPPYRPGKTSLIGDKVFGSNVIVECNVRDLSPPMLYSGSSGIGVGGVGVLGGAGIGRWDAIAAIYVV